MMELIAEYQIRKNPSQHGFTEVDLHDLSIQKEGRFDSFKEGIRKGDFDQYLEGTMNIMHKVYKRALAGRRDEGITDGVRAMFDLIAKLNPNKTYQTHRSDEEYKRALQDPQALQFFLR